MHSEPYTIEIPSPGHALIRFAQICDHTRTTQHEKQLSELVENNTHVVCELSQTWVMSSDWLRWLGRLMLKAKRLHKEFVIVGMSESLLDSADALALKDKFTYTKTIEEAWAR